MIDLDELERRAMACADSTTKICVVSSVSIVELITRLRQAEKDASRYLWLRDIGRHECGTYDFFDGASRDVDSYIDEAMQCK